jgi:hypothetical protein
MYRLINILRHKHTKKNCATSWLYLHTVLTEENLQIVSYYIMWKCCTFAIWSSTFVILTVIQKLCTFLTERTDAYHSDYICKSTHQLVFVKGTQNLLSDKNSPFKYYLAEWHAPIENVEKYQLDARIVIYYHKISLHVSGICMPIFRSRCPKHVAIFMIVNHNCCIKLVHLNIFTYDAQSHKHQIFSSWFSIKNMQWIKWNLNLCDDIQLPDVSFVNSTVKSVNMLQSCRNKPRNIQHSYL